jgi:hypothetical protein
MQRSYFVLGYLYIVGPFVTPPLRNILPCYSQYSRRSQPHSYSRLQVVAQHQNTLARVYLPLAERERERVSTTFFAFSAEEIQIAAIQDSLMNALMDSPN